MLDHTAWNLDQDQSEKMEEFRNALNLAKSIGSLDTCNSNTSRTRRNSNNFKAPEKLITNVVQDEVSLGSQGGKLSKVVPRTSSKGSIKSFEKSKNTVVLNFKKDKSKQIPDRVQSVLDSEINPEQFKKLTNGSQSQIPEPEKSRLESQLESLPTSIVLSPPVKQITNIVQDENLSEVSLGSQGGKLSKVFLRTSSKGSIKSFEKSKDTVVLNLKKDKKVRKKSKKFENRAELLLKKAKKYESKAQLLMKKIEIEKQLMEVEEQLMELSDSESELDSESEIL